MPTINFSFQGFLNGVVVESATDANGNNVDVSLMTEKELVDKLKKGELFISLKEHLDNYRSRSIDIFDYSF